MTLATLLALQKTEPLLVKRLGQLQERLQAGDEAAWPEFLGVLNTLARSLSENSDWSLCNRKTTSTFASGSTISSQSIF